jgi:hypothetical protein
MTNYAPGDARATLFFRKRKIQNTPAQRGFKDSNNETFIYEYVKYYGIVFDTDLPGEHTMYIEPFSEVEGSLAGNASGSPDRDLPIPYWYPIEEIRELRDFVGDGATELL